MSDDLCNHCISTTNSAITGNQTVSQRTHLLDTTDCGTEGTVSYMTVSQGDSQVCHALDCHREQCVTKMTPGVPQRTVCHTEHMMFHRGQCMSHI